jgi:hypothetical protein
VISETGGPKKIKHFLLKIRVKRVPATLTAQQRDGIEPPPAVANGADADFLQVLLRQARQDLFIDFVHAESRFVLPRPSPRAMAIIVSNRHPWCSVKANDWPNTD